MQPPHQLAPLRPHQLRRIGEPGRARRGELEVELHQVGLGPVDLGEPGGDPLLPGLSQRVDLAIGLGRQPVGPLVDDQTRLLQPRQGDVDLTGVHRPAHRTEGPSQPKTQVIAV